MKKLIIGPILLFFFFSAQKIDPLITFLFSQNGSQVTLVSSNFPDSQIPYNFETEITINNEKLNKISIENIEKSNISVNVVFLIDNSKTVYRYERDLPGLLIKQFLDDPFMQTRGQVGIISFDQSIHQILASTNNAGEIVEASQKLQFDSEKSDFSAAILDTIALMAETDAENVEKKQIILISDGAGYNDTKINEKQIADRLTLSGVSLSVLVARNTNTGLYDTYDFNRLNRLASDSGGIALKSDNGYSSAIFREAFMEKIMKTMVIQAELPESLMAGLDEEADLSLIVSDSEREIAQVTKRVHLLPFENEMEDEQGTGSESISPNQMLESPQSSIPEENFEGQPNTQTAAASLVPVIIRTKPVSLLPTITQTLSASFPEGLQITSSITPAEETNFLSEKDRQMFPTPSSQQPINEDREILSPTTDPTITRTTVPIIFTATEVVSPTIVPTKTSTAIPRMVTATEKILPTIDPTRTRTSVPEIITATKVVSPTIDPTQTLTSVPLVSTAIKTVTQEISSDNTKTTIEATSPASENTPLQIVSATQRNIPGRIGTATPGVLATVTPENLNLNATPFVKPQLIEEDAAVTEIDVSEDSLKITLADLGYYADVDYRGVNVSHQYHILLPQNWSFSKPAELTVFLSHYPLLDLKSQLMVSWNGRSLSSFSLDRSNAENGKAVLEIPAELLRSGINTLTIQFLMGFHSDFCEDFDQPDIWAVVHPETSIELHYKKQKPILDLKRFPEDFIDPSPLATNMITIILPNKPLIAEIEAAALVSAKLGQTAITKSLKLGVMSLDQFSLEQPVGSVIFIGKAELLLSSSEDIIPPFRSNISEGIEFLDAEGKPVGMDAGIFWIQTNPYDSFAAALTLTGASVNGLQQAVETFASKMTLDRYSGPIGITTDDPSPTNMEEKPALYFELTDMGYHVSVNNGILQQSKILNIPNQLVLTGFEDPSFHFDFSYSAIGDSPYSYLDISVNQIPVQRIPLENVNFSNKIIDITIPLKLFRSGDNQIEVTSNIQIGNDQDTDYCVQIGSLQAWMKLNQGASFSFASPGTRNEENFAYFPLTLIQPASLDNLAFILPDETDWPSISVALLAANRLGRYTQVEPLQLKVFSAFDQSSEKTNRSVQILIGQPSQNHAIRDINSELPLPFTNYGMTLKIPEKITNVIPASNQYGLIQSLPLEASVYRLILTGNSPEALRWVSTILDSPDHFNHFYGNVQVVSGEGQSASFRIYRPQTDQNIQESDNESDSAFGLLTNMYGMILIAGSIILVWILVSAITWLRKRR